MRGWLLRASNKTGCEQLRTATISSGSQLLRRFARVRRYVMSEFQITAASVRSSDVSILPLIRPQQRSSRTAFRDALILALKLLEAAAGRISLKSGARLSSPCLSERSFKNVPTGRGGSKCSDSYGGNDRGVSRDELVQRFTDAFGRSERAFRHLSWRRDCGLITWRPRLKRPGQFK